MGYSDRFGEFGRPDSTTSTAAIFWGQTLGRMAIKTHLGQLM